MVAPIIQNPVREYLYVIAFISTGLLLYIPFVWLKWRLPGLKSFNSGFKSVFGLAEGDKVIEEEEEDQDQESVMTRL